MIATTSVAFGGVALTDTTSNDGLATVCEVAETPMAGAQVSVTKIIATQRNMNHPPN
jgi:hypothetical protein